MKNFASCVLPDSRTLGSGASRAFGKWRCPPLCNPQQWRFPGIEPGQRHAIVSPIDPSQTAGVSVNSIEKIWQRDWLLAKNMGYYPFVQPTLKSRAEVRYAACDLCGAQDIPPTRPIFCAAFPVQ